MQYSRMSHGRPTRGLVRALFFCRSESLATASAAASSNGSTMIAGGASSSTLLFVVCLDRRDILRPRARLQAHKSSGCVIYLCQFYCPVQSLFPRQNLRLNHKLRIDPEQHSSTEPARLDQKHVNKFSGLSPYSPSRHLHATSPLPYSLAVPSQASTVATTELPRL